MTPSFEEFEAALGVVAPSKHDRKQKKQRSSSKQKKSTRRNMRH
jgi:hypothetical protein